MKYVDLIIRYLSGDVNEDDARAFRDGLERDSVLREEYEQVSAALRLIRDQMEREDLEAFRSKLLEVMEKPAAHSIVKKNGWRSSGKKWIFLLSVAAALAVLVAVWTLRENVDPVFSRFYNPDDDPVVLACSQDPRGSMEMGIALYNQGRFESSRAIMEERLELETSDQLALLYYLLTSIELRLEGEAIDAVKDSGVQPDHPLGRSIYWYASMACIKCGKYDDAAAYLAPLKERSGPYQKRAGRLIKRLGGRITSP